MNEEMKIVELYQQGKTLREIAREALGVQSVEHVTTVLKNHPESGYFPGRRRTRRYKYFYNERFFRRIDSEAKAYYFGLFAADGWIKFHARQVPAAVCFEQIVPDREILDYLHDLMGEQAPPVRVRKLNPDWPNTGQNKARLVFHSAKMARDLVQKGLGLDKTYQMEGLSQHVPVSLRHHYARGYFDGDGSVVIYKYRTRVQIRGTLSFLEDLQAIIPAEVRITNSQKWPNLRTDKHSEAIKFFEWLYRDATIFLQRKHDKYISGLER